MQAGDYFRAIIRSITLIGFHRVSSTIRPFPRFNPSPAGTVGNEIEINRATQRRLIYGRGNVFAFDVQSHRHAKGPCFHDDRVCFARDFSSIAVASDNRCIPFDAEIWRIIFMGDLPLLISYSKCFGCGDPKGKSIPADRDVLGWSGKFSCIL